MMLSTPRTSASDGDSPGWESVLRVGRVEVPVGETRIHDKFFVRVARQKLDIRVKEFNRDRQTRDKVDCYNCAMREITRGRLWRDQLEPPFRLGWPRQANRGDFSRRELATREGAMRVGRQKLDDSSQPYIRNRMTALLNDQCAVVWRENRDQGNREPGLVNQRAVLVTPFDE